MCELNGAVNISNCLISTLPAPVLVRSLSDLASCRVQLSYLLVGLEERRGAGRQQQIFADPGVVEIGLNCVNFASRVSATGTMTEGTDDKRGQRLHNLINEVRFRLTMVDFRADVQHSASNDPLTRRKFSAFQLSQLCVILDRIEHS
uniref:Uncharacterized protein n=1 Tax=Plectus sambesii TaxID=2011161 RepID=A0A914VZE3_9BILA